MSVYQTTIITEGLLSRNGTGFLVPLIKNHARLKQIGIDIKFKHVSKKFGAQEGDCIIVESQAIKRLYRRNKDVLLQALQKLKENTDQLIFYDLNDDSCTGYFDLLPYVDKYCKSYVLRDRNIYKRDLYGGRIWTDFYHKNNGINDDPVYVNCPITDENELKKIRTGYLLGLVDYSEGSVFAKSGRLREMLRRAGLLGLFLKGPKNSDFILPGHERSKPVSCRISTQYPMQRDTLTYHREYAAEILSDRIMVNKLSRDEYLAELSDSKIVLSPFGWGEINVARDYEVAMSGAILMKPDLQHMESYPNIFNEQSTVQFKWDFSDLLEKIDEVIDNYNDFLGVAESLQEAYKYHMCSEAGKEEFCNYFKHMLE